MRLRQVSTMSPSAIGAEVCLTDGQCLNGCDTDPYGDQVDSNWDQRNGTSNLEKDCIQEWGDIWDFQWVNMNGL